MTDIKGIIFDYGGTIDTNGIHWAEVIWEQYEKAGCNVAKELFRTAYVHAERMLAKQHIIETSDTFRILLEKKTALQFDYLRKEYNITLTTGQQHSVAQGCYQKVLDTLAVTRPVVERLSLQYPMILVTNFYGNMPVVLEEFALHNYFRKIVESSVVGLRKPDPALFALGVKALDIPAENILVIGDSYRKDIYPASSLGCQTIWLKNICWEEEPILPDKEPTAVINNLNELYSLL